VSFNLSFLDATSKVTGGDMRTPIKIGRLFTPGFIFLLAVLACNLPAGIVTPDVQATSAAQTATAAAGASIPATETSTPLAIATNTSLPSATSTPQNPLVIKDALCWEGPGPAYLVVSAVKNGERVALLGRGSISGWWVIENPIYHDPCWLQEDVLQIDPGYDLSDLKIINPPPTPTPKPTDTPSPTNTP
jgi:hypothetical protein